MDEDIIAIRRLKTRGAGAPLWHSLGAKTIELIHLNVHVSAVRDDLDKIVLDAELLEAVLKTDNPDHKAKELPIKIVDRLHFRCSQTRQAEKVEN